MRLRTVKHLTINHDACPKILVVSLFSTKRKDSFTAPECSVLACSSLSWSFSFSSGVKYTSGGSVWRGGRVLVLALLLAVIYGS